MDFSLMRARERVEEIFYAEQLRWILFLPVAFGAGIYFYFSLLTEPSAAVVWLSLLASVLVLAAIFLISESSFLFLAGVAIVVGFLGFSTAFYRAHSAAAPVVSAKGEAVITARIKSIDATRAKKTQVWLVAPSSGTDVKYLRVRVKPFKGRAAFRAGDEIKVHAFLLPPPRKALPDSADHGRTFWFKQLGGTALALTPPQKIKSAPLNFSARDSSVRDFSVRNFLEWLDQKRNEIARHIDKTLSPPSAAGVAAALIVGKRGFISEAISDKLRGTGLAHILAISGLHMAAFAGTIYFVLRFLLALCRPLALRYPIKKWAMVPALLSAVVYLFLSGYSVSTQRAFIMFVVVGFAVLRGANALTLRNLAFAALIILFFFPESLLQAGFQLSFAATLGIVAAYERLQFSWFKRSAKDQQLAKLRRRLFVGAMTLLITSAVAWAATAPFALTHFNRLGFIPAMAGNFFVLPIFTLWIMPAVVLSVLGLGTPALPWLLEVLGQGLEVILSLINSITENIGTAQIIAAPPNFVLGIFIIGGLWLCLWQEVWRWAGAALLVLAFSLNLFLSKPAPDIIIHEDVLAVRGADRKLYPSAPKAWLVEQWLRADGDGRSAWGAFRQNKNSLTCDRNKCQARVKNYQVVLAKRPIACTTVQADIFIGNNCYGRWASIRPQDLKTKGVHLIFLPARKNEALTIQHQPAQKRLWLSIPETARPAALEP